MAHLVLISGGEPGLVLPLDRDQTVLGRDAECHIVIAEAMVRRDDAGARVASVSRRHAVISRQDGKYTIEDGDGRGKPSRNHTFVNDQKVPFPGASCFTTTTASASATSSAPSTRRRTPRSPSSTPSITTAASSRCKPSPPTGSASSWKSATASAIRSKSIPSCPASSTACSNSSSKPTGVSSSCGTRSPASWSPACPGRAGPATTPTPCSATSSSSNAWRACKRSSATTWPSNSPTARASTACPCAR